jgi:hypothetical protein
MLRLGVKNIGVMGKGENSSYCALSTTPSSKYIYVYIFIYIYLNIYIYINMYVGG